MRMRWLFFATLALLAFCGIASANLPQHQQQHQQKQFHQPKPNFFNNARKGIRQRLTTDIFGVGQWRSKAVTLSLILADGVAKVYDKSSVDLSQNKRLLKFLQNFFEHTPIYIGVLTFAAFLEYSLLLFQMRVTRDFEALGSKRERKQNTGTVSRRLSFLCDIIPASRLISEVIGFFLEDNNYNQKFEMSPEIVRRALLDVPLYFAIWLVCGNLGAHLLSMLARSKNSEERAEK